MDLASRPGHSFCRELNGILFSEGFAAFVGPPWRVYMDRACGRFLVLAHRGRSLITSFGTDSSHPHRQQSCSVSASLRQFTVEVCQPSPRGLVRVDTLRQGRWLQAEMSGPQSVASLQATAEPESCGPTSPSCLPISSSSDNAPAILQRGKQDAYSTAFIVPVTKLRSHEDLVFLATLGPGRD